MQLRVLNLLGRPLSEKEASIITAEDPDAQVCFLLHRELKTYLRYETEIREVALSLSKVIIEMFDKDPSRIGAVLVPRPSTLFFSYLNDILADKGVLPLAFNEYENGVRYVMDLFDRDLVMIARGHHEANEMAKILEANQR